MSTRHTDARYERITGDRTMPYHPVKHSLRDHYRVDTAMPFDLAMYATRREIADAQYQLEGRMVVPRCRAPRAPRVPVERRRRSVGLAVAELLPAAIVIGLALYAVVRILAGTGPQ